jgi:hypothetical protein
VTKKDFVTAFANSEAAIQHNLDMKIVYETISITRKYGHGTDLTYHEYIASAMHKRVTVSENRLMLLFSYLDPGKCHFLFVF